MSLARGKGSSCGTGGDLLLSSAAETLQLVKAESSPHAKAKVASHVPLNKLITPKIAI